MTIVQMINEFMTFLTQSTINGVCMGLWIFLLAEIWKWFWGVLKRFLFDLFPDLKKKKDTEADV